MGSDDRIRFLAREEILLAREEILQDREEVSQGFSELTEKTGWSGRLDDLHLEIRTLATKVAALEERLMPSLPSRVQAPGYAPAAPRLRARKQTDEPKGSA